MNFKIQSLLRRARKIHTNRGIIKLLKLTVSFGTRYSKEKIGRWWFYNLDIHLDFLYWLNTGRGQYQALADPFCLLEVDPDTIEYVTGRGPFPGRFRWQDIGLITGGKWDQSTELFDELPKVCKIQQRFRENKQWGEIQLENISVANQSTWCSNVDELYKSIRVNGYKYQYEMLPNCVSPRPFGSENNCSGIERFRPCDEVVVDIGRDGQFLFVDGRHRLAIAKILGIDEIPVRVSARHEEWQRVREQVAETPQSELSEEIKQHLEHPDLKELLDEKRHE